MAVDFFFCLSGFVIAFAYEERLRTKLKLSDFIVARLIRFYPMFLIGTLFAFLTAFSTQHLLSTTEGRLSVLHSLPSLLFVPSKPLAPCYKLFPLNNPSWTLLTELVANLGFGFLVRRKLPLRAVLGSICVLSAAELLLTPLKLDSGSTWPGFGVGMARMGFSFPLGVLLFHIWRKLPMGGLRRERGLLGGIVVVAVLLLSITLHTTFTHLRVYQLSVMTLLMPALILVGADVRLNAACNKACAALGDLSYPLYIMHVPLLSPLFGAHVARLAHASAIVRRCLVPACDVALAVFAWVLETYLNAPVRRSLSGAYRRYKQSARNPPLYSTQPFTAESGIAQ